MNLFQFDSQYRQKGYKVIAGIDEAGRGPWAGPVVASAVILNPEKTIQNLNDSKQLTHKQRENIYQEITESAISWGLGIINREIIDSVNILQATYLAMKNALESLTIKPNIVLVDGLPVPDLGIEQEPVISGDSKSSSIAAASIIAKVTRDRLMVEYSQQFPQYKFEKHKGYGTREHREALSEFGPCPLHRMSFRPVKKLLNDH